MALQHQSIWFFSKMFLQPTILLWWILCAIIGGAIGSLKNKTAQGILLGALLGPIGVLIVTFLEKVKDPSEQNNKCPVCAGGIDSGYRKCKNCSADLIWHNGIPGEPGSENELKRRFDSRQEQLHQEKLKLKKNRKNFCVILFLAICPFIVVWVLVALGYLG